MFRVYIGFRAIRTLRNNAGTTRKDQQVRSIELDTRSATPQLLQHRTRKTSTPPPPKKKKKTNTLATLTRRGFGVIIVVV